MSSGIVDVLMITYQRPEYTEIALRGLLDNADDRTRIWLWHNGRHQATLDVVEKLRMHPKVWRFHHEPDPASTGNKMTQLTAPTNWVWNEGEGDFVAKVDDDCLCEEDWIGRLRAAHEANAKLGAIGCWIHHAGDFDSQLAKDRIVELAGGHKLLRTRYLGGRGYMLKRECIRQYGPLTTAVPFFDYLMRLSDQWDIGIYYPLLVMEHFDDSRSPYTMLKSDADLIQFAPLTAKHRKMTRLSEWKKNQQLVAYRTLTHSLSTKTSSSGRLVGLARKVSDFVGFQRFLWRHRNESAN